MYSTLKPALCACLDGRCGATGGATQQYPAVHGYGCLTFRMFTAWRGAGVWMCDCNAWGLHGWLGVDIAGAIYSMVSSLQYG